MNDVRDGAALLERYNPVLIIFPQEPDRRTRPGALRPGKPGWGDYHPCSAEFFLSRAHLRTRSPGYDLAGLLPRSWKAPDRTGLDAIKSRVALMEPEDTGGWELDVADIPSQNEGKAWRTYGAMLREEGDHAYRCVVYGRFITRRGESEREQAHALQYWYLYLYNDFRNNHEADWEMVTIELKDGGAPDRIGLSSHHAGTRRRWSQVERLGDRPVVHVALGSHAGYFSYNPKGYDALRLTFLSNLPRVLNLIVSGVKRLPWIRRWRDKPAADAERDCGAKPEHVGVRVSPELRVFPENVDRPEDADRWWWMRYRGRWGSGRSRIAGTVGIATPWRVPREGPLQDWRWRDPARWLADCEEDEV